MCSGQSVYVPAFPRRVHANTGLSHTYVHKVLERFEATIRGKASLSIWMHKLRLVLRGRGGWSISYVLSPPYVTIVPST
jgi:hypothetical protein